MDDSSKADPDIDWCDRQESNLYPELRRLVSYPLDDGRNTLLGLRDAAKRRSGCITDVMLPWIAAARREDIVFCRGPSMQRPIGRLGKRRRVASRGRLERGTPQVLHV